MGLELDDNAGVGEKLVENSTLLYLYKLNAKVEEKPVVIDSTQVPPPPQPQPINNAQNIRTFVDNLIAEIRRQDDPFYLPDIPFIRQGLEELVLCGFPEPRAKKALLLNTLQVELALNWLLEHSNDPHIDDHFTEQEIAQISSSFQEILEETLIPPVQDVKNLQTCIQNNICTFSVTGREYYPQTWYHCYTCGLVDSEGCCISCINVCHKGHRLSSPNTSEGFFCDCGSGGSCKCLRQQ